MAIEDFSAIHKVAYGEGVPELVPDFAVIQKDIKFSQKDILGDYFEQAVRLSLPSGFTRALGDGTAGAFTLNGATGGTQKKAKVYGYQLTLQDQIAYEDLVKASKGGAQSYKKSTAMFWEGMQLSMRKMIEINSLYGNVGIGKVQTYTSGTPSITISVSDWAPQIWAGLEGISIEVMNGTTSTVRDNPVTVVSVDIDTRIVTLSGTVSGAAASDIVYFRGGYGKEAPGLFKILSNTTSLFNIDAAVYTNWKAANHAVNAAFSFQALKKGLGKGVAKGLMYPINVYTSLGAFDDLVGDIQQLRTTDKNDVKKIEMGQDEVVYKYAGVAATVKPHPMVKEGHALGVVPQFAKRIGAADVAFGMPNDPEERIWFDLETKAGKEGRMYTHQGIVSEMPAVNVYWSAITNRTT
jgi:hypothetical protein